jgi:hypothetical protein
MPSANQNISDLLAIQIIAASRAMPAIPKYPANPMILAAIKIIPMRSIVSGSYRFPFQSETTTPPNQAMMAK